MKDRTDHSNLKCNNQTEAEVRLDAITFRGDSKIVLDQTTYTEDDHGMDKSIEVGQDLNLIIEVVTGTIQEVVKCMGGLIIIAIIEGEVTGVQIMMGIGVGHTKERTEIKGIVEVPATVDQGQVQEETQIKTELGALSVGNIIILQRIGLTRQTCREAEQIQKIFKMEKGQIILQTLLMDTD